MTHNQFNNKYQSPSQECDIIMKGGITSGIVYPSAICELAKKFRFRQIGGTSAGAIVAALTAAAEYGRNEGGFEKLTSIPDELSEEDKQGNTKLFKLFKPQKKTKDLFYTLLILFDDKMSKLQKVNKIISFFKKSISKWAKLGIILGLLFWLGFITLNVATTLYFMNEYNIAVNNIESILMTSLYLTQMLIFTGIILLINLIVLLLCCISPITNIFKMFLFEIPKNYYGMCSGITKNANKNTPPLTLWLYQKIQNLSNVNYEKPLTFGDLNNNDIPIDLKMITTCLTHGRPYSLPLSDDDNVFYFKKEEFEDFFPVEVVEYMSILSNQYKEKGEIYYKFPAVDDLPIIVATRMSLSFPILLSALPLYTLDQSMKQSENKILEKCWFSDGGIVCNFPITFFDSPLPKRPTFGINLRPPHKEHPISDIQKENVWMPSKMNQGKFSLWNRFDHCKDIVKMLSFFFAIINSMQNWIDNTQSTMPGYRERIVHVDLSDNEGGLNLNMPSELVLKLKQRGLYAGQELSEHYDKSNNEIETNWINHRWIRYRSSIECIKDFLEKFNSGYSLNNNEISQLIDNPSIYEWRQGQKEIAKDFTDKLIHITFGETDDLKEGSPKPEPKLQISPKI